MIQHIQNYNASGVWPAQQDIKAYEKATASVDSRPSTTSDSEIFAPRLEHSVNSRVSQKITTNQGL